MDVPSRITTAEMREAYRLNFSAAFLLKLFLSNPRLLGIFTIAVFVGVFSVFHPTELTAGRIASVLGMLGFCAIFVWFIICARVSSEAQAINKALATYHLDSKGITELRPDGSHGFVPWSAIGKWSEGESVFTVGGPTIFRAISKSSLGAVQISELRSLLQSQLYRGAAASSAFSR